MGLKSFVLHPQGHSTHSGGAFGWELECAPLGLPRPTLEDCPLCPIRRSCCSCREWPGRKGAR